MRRRVLFIDDDATRLKRLRSIAAEAGALADIRWRKTAASVTSDDLAWAQVVFLDHDMCEGGEYPEPCPNAESLSDVVLPPCKCPTGYVVATAIADMVRSTQMTSPPRVVIQSVNPAGAARMAHIVGDAGVTVVRAPAAQWFGVVPARLWAQMVGEEA